MTAVFTSWMKDFTVPEALLSAGQLEGWRTEGRIQFGKPGKVGDGCFELLLDSRQEKVLMYEEMMEVVKGQVREMNLQLEKGALIIGSQACQDTLP